MGRNQNSALIFLIVLLFIIIIAMTGYILWDKLIDTKSEINSDNIEVNNVNVFKLSSMKCLNSDSKFRLSGFERYYSGLSVLFENDRFYLELYPDSDLAEVYPEVKSGVKVEIKGLDTTSVADVFISHVGSDLRMPQVLFLMEDGTVYAIDSMKALTDGLTFAQKLDNVQNTVQFITVNEKGVPGQTTLAITANGDAYKIYGNLSISKIAIGNFETQNVSLYKALGVNFSISAEYFYGISVKQKEDKFYLELDKNSDLAKEYSDAKCGTLVEVEGIDGTRVSQVKIKHRGSDVRMPDVLFLMEDGTVYSVDCRQALTTGDSKAQKLEQITGVATMKYAYMDNTPGQVVLGFKTNGDYYLLND